MIPGGVSNVMNRIGRIQSLAERASGSFGGALGAAMMISAPSQSAVPSQSAPTTVAPASSTTDTSDIPLPAGAARWQASIDRAALAEGLDPKLFTAVVWLESNFVPDAVSHAGAIGLAQLMPATADLLGVDPYDPEQNLAGGARFLSDMIEKFGRVDLGLAAYNAGPARIAREHDGGPGVPVVPGYVEAVFNRYRQLGGTP
jgi:soluble lytic murein transglycosylase-like protein